MHRAAVERCAPYHGVLGQGDLGEVALIVALIGLQMNMISQRAYALVIVMAGVTTLLPPPFLRILFSPQDKQNGTGAGEESAEVQISGRIS